jgi:hypothetical protein
MISALGCSLSLAQVTEQVKKRCRWLLGFARDVLAPIRGKAEDPFEGAEVDANALGWALVRPLLALVVICMAVAGSALLSETVWCGPCSWPAVFSSGCPFLE